MTDTEKARIYISKMYHRIFKVSPVIRNRNNMLFYPLLEMWCYNSADPQNSTGIYRLVILCRLIYKALFKFPDAGTAITGSLLDKIPYCETSVPELCWMHGYFSRLKDEVEYSFGSKDEVITVNEICQLQAALEEFSEACKELEISKKEDPDDSKE